MIRSRHFLGCLALATACLLAAGGCGTSDDTAGAGASADPELHAKLPASIRDAGTMTVGTDASYPPCDYMNDQNKIDGFNHDILMAMADRLGIEIAQRSLAFDGLLPGVQAGRFSAAMECITDNADREKQVTFVDYAYAVKGVMTTSSNPGGVTENPLSLCGLKAGVQTGTEFVGDAARYSKNCEKSGRQPLAVTNFPTAADQNTALRSGRIDLAFTDLATGEWQKKVSGNPFSVFTSPLMARTYVGIVVKKQDTELAEALRSALAAMVEDGSYSKIMKSWSLDDIALDTPGINLASTRPLELPQLCGACGK